ncbi:uncharacterized protein LOC129584736 [Paramacrobiotus metropolitanus]|uniref:uncharacterized protein LOC129584736 n=1 Tax=Paramacrobiotus metropolitanus TaxID=2943436 RepID=UPI002445D343|nr:uncharacterized protein LOC129584736 [Paramacrobiotus metropolitanus]
MNRRNREILRSGVWCTMIVLCIVRTSHASPTNFPFAALRRQPRNFITPYWLSPCGESGTVTASKPLSFQPSSSKSLKHHYLAIRNYAEALDKLVQALETKKMGGDPYLPNQIKQFKLDKFPRPPTFSDNVVSAIVGQSPSTLLVEVYRLLQIVAVHLSSTESDEIAFEGRYQDDLDDLQRGPSGLQALMCSVRLGMKHAGVDPVDNSDVLKTIYTTPIRDYSQRNLRDILRLDGTSYILEYVKTVFNELYGQSTQK